MKKSDWSYAKQKRIDKHQNIIHDLKSAAIDFEEPLILNCGELISLNSPEEQLKKGHDFQPYYDLLPFNDCGMVYYWKLPESSDNERILNTLRAYKEKKERSCPRLPKSAFDTNCLYVGSVRDGFAGRFFIHCGYGNRSTYGLQLSRWAINLNLRLELHFTRVQPDTPQMIENIEGAIADYLNPLVGKRVS